MKQYLRNFSAGRLLTYVHNVRHIGLGVSPLLRLVQSLNEIRPTAHEQKNYFRFRFIVGFGKNEVKRLQSDKMWAKRLQQ